MGALCLDYTDDIHRPPGDPLNEISFQFPLIHEQVKNGTVQNIVFGGKFSDKFLDAFVDASNKLADRGAIGIITSCGFLAQVQTRLMERVKVPVATSSLIQLPMVLLITSPKKKVAILTFDGSQLGKLHFDGLGLTEQQQSRLVVHGCKDDGHLKELIINGKPYIHEELVKELVSLAKYAIEQDPTIGAFVLECTQMPPTSKAIQAATGLPVYDVITMIDHFYTGLKARTLPEDEFKEDGLRIRTRSAKEFGSPDFEKD